MLLKNGSKGSLVLTMQKLLKSIGFDITCDGIFGPGTDKIIRLYQENALLKVDGLVGNQTYNSIISTSKNVTKNYKEQITWVNPKDLKGTLVNSTGASLSAKFKNLVNGAFFWHQSGVGNKIIGWFYSEGKCINYSNYNRYRGTFLVKKDGTVISKRFNDAELMSIRNDMQFVVQGFDGIKANPDIEGTSTAEVGRKCLRPILGFNPKTNKVLIAVFNGDYRDIEQVLKKHSCTVGIGLDGGGSTNMFVNGKSIYKTSRVLNNIIYW